MKNVHGKFTSFKEMGAALGIKSKEKAEKPRKCKVCGGLMNKVAGNVWVCPFHKVTIEKLGDTEVQVFSECGNRVITDPYA